MASLAAAEQNVGRHIAKASDFAPGASRPGDRREPLHNYEHKKL